MNTIYDLVIGIVGTPPTEQAETVLYIVAGFVFLFVGFQF